MFSNLFPFHRYTIQHPHWIFIGKQIMQIYKMVFILSENIFSSRIPIHVTVF